MFITNENELSQQLGGIYDLILQEIKFQYPNQILTLLQATTKNDLNYIYSVMAFTIKDKEAVLFITTTHSVYDTYEGYIDEFYEEGRDIVLGYMNSHETS